MEVLAGSGFRGGGAFAATGADAFVAQKGSCHGPANQGSALNLGAKPDAEFEDVSEFLRSKIPAVLVASGVGGKVVVEGVASTRAVGLDMVGIPRSIDEAATDVTSTSGFREDRFPVRRTEVGPGPTV